MALSLVVLGSAQADVIFGGSRRAAMGGAGLALPIDFSQSTRYNPALLGFGGRGVDFTFPQLGYRANGIDLGDIQDYLGDIGSGGLDVGRLNEFARRFGRRTSEFGVNGNAGISFGGFSFGGDGEAAVTMKPNAPLRAYNGSGNVPANAQLDAYGFGYYSLNAGYGGKVRVPNGRLALGGTVKSVTGYYAHKIAGNINGNTAPVNGADISGGSDTIRKSGVGFDLGAVYSTEAMPNVYYGAVIENLVRPNVKFNRQLDGDNNLGGPGTAPVIANGVDPFKTVTSVGVGAMLGRNILVAADLYDIGNNAGRSEFRSGVEFQVARGFALSAGYNSRSAISVGVSVFGFSVTLAGRQPLTVGAAVRF